MAHTSLLGALPKPKYTGEEEEEAVQSQSRGPRIVGAGALDESQIVLKVYLVEDAAKNATNRLPENRPSALR
jgi:hypothetical protein